MSRSIRTIAVVAAIVSSGSTMSAAASASASAAGTAVASTTAVARTTAAARTSTSVPSPSAPDLVGTPEQIGAALVSLGAPNTFCAQLQLYAVGVLGGQLAAAQQTQSTGTADTGQVPTTATSNQFLAAMAPLMSVLANDAVANPPEGFPEALHPAQQALAELFGRVVAELRTNGVPDAVLAASIASPSLPDTPGSGSAAITAEDAATFERAAAAVTVDIEAEFRSIGDRLIAGAAPTFDFDLYCPNLATLGQPAGATTVADLIAKTGAPNNFCALMQVYAVASVAGDASATGTVIDPSTGDADRRLALYLPALGALATSTYASPPAALDDAVWDLAGELQSLFSASLDELRRAGVADDVLLRLARTVPVDPTSAPAESVGADDLAAIDTALASAPSTATLGDDSAAAFERFAQTVPREWLAGFCPNMAGPAGG